MRTLTRTIRFCTTMALIGAGIATARISSAQNSSTDAKPTETRPAENKPADQYQVIYLTNLTVQNEANDIQTALRNMLPKTRVYYVPSESALTLRGSPEDIQLAEKIVSDLNKPHKTYRLTYTITENDSGRPASVQHFSLILLLGNKTTVKQGTRVPIVTGSFEAETSKANTQVQYVDVGLNVEASLEGSIDGLRLRTKIEQSSPADEKSSVGSQDPIIRQSVLEATAGILLGKSVVLGSLDVPGTSRHQEVEVVSELVR